MQIVQRAIQYAKRSAQNESAIVRGWFESFLGNREKTMENDIDIVVTWVDGNDEKWLAQKNQYMEIAGFPPENGVCRYRDWSFFRYWFRSIEKYAPWYRNLYFVTWGHVPSWLNVDNPRLKIVKHEDFIPKEYLPTFSSIPIELNLHRIPGLSEHFIYFNDDVFLAKPCGPTDFFVNGKPVLQALASPITNFQNQVPSHILFSTIGAVNQYTGNVSECMRRNAKGWFSHTHGRFLKYNIQALKDNYLYGLAFHHIAVPFCKGTFFSAWEKYPPIEKTCKNRFRTPMDVMHQIISAEQMLSGCFEPVNSDNLEVNCEVSNVTEIDEVLRAKKYLILALSDADNYTDQQVKKYNADCCDAFEKYFPQKSSFEID